MKIYVVGLGPGAMDQMTQKAISVLEKCDVIIGYQVYVDLIKDEFPGKIFMTTAMKKEVDRCKLCFEEALKGQDVAMVCSGDGGVYGMAGLIYEVSKDYEAVEIEVVAGVTAAMSGGATLGAPLCHDFAVISLSDLLTPWELIEKRLNCAAEGDFAICLYNPSSKKRYDYLEKACNILLKYRSGETVTGVVRNIGREGEEARLMSLNELKTTEVDMFTTVFIGNSSTKNIGGKMVTPRGYRQ